jgi:riboflavin kinase/FMN adenylyltransferase
MEIVTLEKHTHYDLPDTVCAIGFFDGVHLGHQALIKEVLKVSAHTGLKKAVMTFDQHPLAILKGEKTHYLTSFEKRCAILEAMGIEVVYVIAFDKEVAGQAPAAFVKDYLVANNVKHVVAGFDFHFGDHNKGSIEDLKALVPHVSVIAPIYYDDKQKVSSTLLKSLVRAGTIPEANRLMGRPFEITGAVIHGKQRGRLMGFPTANVAYGSFVLPAHGVYAVKVYIKDKTYIGMGNIGTNPTFDDIHTDSLEINIFDFDEDIYGEMITVAFYKQTRGEIKFASMEELKDQLISDHQIITDYFTGQNENKA